jgi:ubiquinone/menaquinone biosynthesis C-methylase UbiE
MPSMPSSSPSNVQSEAPPSPIALFDAMNAFHKSAALKSAIELDVFTAIADGVATPAGLAAKCGAAERGIRILCDYLVVQGFLTKSGGAYGLTPVSGAFLSKRSPAYMGSAVEFLMSPVLAAGFADLTGAVRHGGTTMPQEGTLAPEHDVWVSFARAMAPLMAMPAEEMAKMVLAGSTQPMRVLDIAASHGLYGLAFARQNPNARVTGLDWRNVLEVAKENAAKMGLADRYDSIAGSAFEADLGGPYDVVLLPNFLHHFDPPTIEKLLARIRATMKPGGRVATLEFVPNDDRVSPPGPATFAIIMLSNTPAGDAYTLAEYDRMFRNAGFGKSELHRMGDAPHAVIVTQME